MSDADDLRWVPAHEIVRRVQKGDLSAVAVTERALERIEREDRRYNAFLHVDWESSLAAAHAVDRKVARGEATGALAGCPVALKDNICVRGLPTTCASRILEHYRPPYDAHVVELLRAEDAVIVGKTNMDEFAMGSSTENSAFGVTRNPWDVSRAPGGSSGGSAVAVAAGLVPLSLGSDTGGSVRQPGAFCGVTAVKPTHGRVSRYGLVAFASSLDQIGPFARDADDARLAMSVISSPDQRDATCTARPATAREHDDRGVNGLRVGVVRPMLDAEGNHPQVSAAVNEALRVLTGAGCTVVDVDLPHAQYALSVYYLVAPAEASANLARFDGVRYGFRAPAEDLTRMYTDTRGEGFGPEVQRRIMLGTHALSAGYYDALYGKAQRVRTLIRRDFHRAFAQCDVILSPTTPTPAFTLGAKTSDCLSMYMADIYTLPASMAGLPAINVPAGFADGDLPVGLQCVGPLFSEEKLLSLASRFESLTPWHGRHPEVHA